MSKLIYEINNLKKCYGARCVLDIEKLNIRKGEILAVVGPSGAGKSTLLRLLNFLEPATGGDITFDGQPVNSHMPVTQRRRVTTVFQHPVLLKRNVVANLKYGLALRGEKLSREKASYWLAHLGLSSLANQHATKLSAGEAQRVALARALLVRPDVLLLDEPTANLDPFNVQLIESIVKEENQVHQTTIVLVTHNIFQARRVAHRTALILNGELVEIKDTETFFTNPDFPETRAFVRGETVY